MGMLSKSLKISPREPAVEKPPYLLCSIIGIHVLDFFNEGPRPPGLRRASPVI